MMLKDAANKKMKLRVTGCYQGEYMYILTKNGLILKYKDYTIIKDKGILT